jgi:hypothetical protein
LGSPQTWTCQKGVWVHAPNEHASPASNSISRTPTQTARSGFKAPLPLQPQQQHKEEQEEVINQRVIRKKQNVEK